MANYYGKTRTNYFKVTDADALCELSNQVCGNEDNVYLEVKSAPDGTKRYMLWCDSIILGIPEGEDDEYIDYNYEEFLCRLQKLLPDDEAVIITEIGSEKMRYLVGQITVVTNKDVQYNNLGALGKEIARKMLKNPDWNTQNEY